MSVYWDPLNKHLGLSQSNRYTGKKEEKCAMSIWFTAIFGQFNSIIAQYNTQFLQGTQQQEQMSDDSNS